MKKKATPYVFKNPNFQIYCVSNIGKKDIDIYDEDIQDVYNGDDEEDTPISPDIREMIYEHLEFNDSLYKFCLNYNEKFKKLRMKKEHQSIDHMYGGLHSPMDITISVKNGVGEFDYSPFDQFDVKHEKKMWGSFKIKKEDMMKFINDFSKKVKFQYDPNTVVENFKRVGNWYSLKIRNKKYNVIIQKSPNSFNCEPSSIIVYDEDNEYVSPLTRGEKIYKQIESLMNKVDFKYDVIDED